jgi:pimeloyl-ACP methyl ester carboxylesterase
VSDYAIVNGARLWYRIVGEGEPIIQIHGSGFGHYNFDPVTPVLSKKFLVVDFDMRGYGQSDRPAQHYDMEVWADDVAGLMESLGIAQAHIHGTSMGGMVALVFAGKYPDKTLSVVINCAAAKFGRAGELMIKNWIDIVRLDPAGVGSRLLAEAVSWQALSRRFLETNDGRTAVERINEILRDSNESEVFIAACEAMIEMDLRPWLAEIRARALVIGGDEDFMTPWDQGPNGAGQGAIHRGIKGAKKTVIKGSAHSSIFDATEEYNQAVSKFFVGNSVQSGTVRHEAVEATNL